MPQEREYSLLSPAELNAEFRALFLAAPAVEMSMLGTLMGADASVEMTPEERVVYLEELAGWRDEIYPGMMLEDVEAGLDETSREFIIDSAKGEAARRRRATSFYNAALLNKLIPLKPFIQGTAAFREEYVPRELERITIDGIGEGGQHHLLYGDDLGGIFHPQSAPAIEMKSFQRFAGDIEWYGVSPIVGRVFVPDYDRDPNYRSAVDLARKWRVQLLERDKRAPLDIHGREIILP
ncbi:hypothetical protein HY024_00445 [Candidatus Curtissbacteria bacterium]|nr:hypothetical protein [Candidatus Curtissbacteria bacterium]